MRRRPAPVEPAGREDTRAGATAQPAAGLVVKVCGIRSVMAAVEAVMAGADLLGFNFAPVSKRRVAPDVARRAIEQCREALPSRCRAAGEAASAPRGLPGDRPAMIGVFVNQVASEVGAMARHCHLDAVQLSGDEDVERCREIAAETGLPVIKAVRLGPQGPTGREGAEETYIRQGGVVALLVDAPVAGAWGGTGQGWDWTRAAPLAQRVPLLLAGGLNAGNVGDAVAAVRPWGVDVASGVETGGQTDSHEVRRFVHSVKGLRSSGR